MLSAYLDDVIIYSPDFDTHLKHLGDVLHKLQEAGIKLAPNKCQFCQCEVQYLGHILSPDDLKPINSTVQRIQSFPTPKNRKEVVGLSWFSRILPTQFHRNRLPSTSDATNRTELSYGHQDQQDAFDHLKHALAQDVILKFPRCRPTIPTCDRRITTCHRCCTIARTQRGIQRPVASYSVEPTETREKLHGY